MSNPLRVKIKNVINDPKLLFIRIMYFLSPLLPDKLYLKIIFRLKLGYPFNVKNPITFNEKMNWLKLYDRQFVYTTMADKYLVKQYVASVIGDKYVVPLIKIWDSITEFDFGQLPDKCVIKTTQDSGGAIIYMRGVSDENEIIRKINKRIHIHNYYYSREWPYKNINTKIEVEQFLDDGSGAVLQDYKFWCFNGVPKIMYCTVKCKDVYENFYDMDFQPLYISHGFRRRIPEFAEPKAFNAMKELAAKLSKDIPFVRVDFFYVDGQIYFGEFTFFDWGGLKPFKDDWDVKLGELLHLGNI